MHRDLDCFRSPTTIVDWTSAESPVNTRRLGTNPPKTGSDRFRIRSKRWRVSNLQADSGEHLVANEAAGLRLVGLTSWQALVDTAKLKPRQRILIHAGSGGIGTFAIQLAKHIGAEVWTTTSGKNLEFVKSLDADHAINYQNEDFEKRVNNVDVVFDTLGGASLDKSFSITRPNGWVVSIAGSPDFRAAKEMDLDIMRSLLSRVVGLRVNSKARSAGVNYRFIFMKPVSEELAQIATLVAKGVIKPVVDRIVPISECQSAIEYCASGRARGKIIIRMID